jgi:hypothetical protein
MNCEKSCSSFGLNSEFRAAVLDNLAVVERRRELLACARSTPI